MRVGDVIVAPSTPPGRAARGLVRLSGPGASTIARRHAALPASRAGAARWRFDAGLDAPVLIAHYAEGASYTGDDVVEIIAAGGLVPRLLDSLLAHDDVRLASPGEFSARAYLAGRLTLEEAEGVAGVIGAETDAQLESARDLMRGETGRRYAEWADELTMLLALVEAGVDFTDQEDVVAIDPAELTRRLDVLASNLDGAAAPTPVDEPLVVLAGPPNAGKSTLFNALLGRRRAVASPEAHTTRDALIEPLDLGADAPGAGVVQLADLAGLDAVDDDAQRRAREMIDRADVVIWCDPGGRFAEATATSTLAVHVRTKGDRPGRDEDADLTVCALDGHVGALRRAIADAAWGARKRGGLAAPRHRRAISVAVAHVRAAAAMDAPEIIAGELRTALDALGELTGKVHPDDVIGRVFATFCIGK